MGSHLVNVFIFAFEWSLARSEERRVGKECRYLCVLDFSSRRRHTRYWRDWSSDVCSSDLFTFLQSFAGLYLLNRNSLAPLSKNVFVKKNSVFSGGGEC